MHYLSKIAVLRWLLAVFFGLCWALSFGVAQAETAADLHEDVVMTSPHLTLHEVLQKTFERNPQQYVLSAMHGEAQARYSQARGMLPSAPAMTFRHQNDTLGSGRGEREWEAEMELPVWLSGQRNARLTLADQSEASVAAGKKSLLLQVAGVLRDALWDMAMNAEQVTLYSARLDTARKLEHDVLRRYHAGELAKTDWMLTQNDTLQAQAGLLKAEAELKHAKHRYIALTGQNEQPAHYTEVLSQLEALNEQHPLLLEWNAKIEATQSERNLVALERRDNPQVILSTRTIRGGFDNQFNDSVGIKIRIPFSTETRNAPLLAAAESNIAKNMAELERLKLAMSTQLHEAEHNLQVTEAELALLKQQHQLAQENARLAKKAFALGEADLVSLMRVQALAFDAERAVSLKTIQHQWDIARYNQAVGVLP